MDGERERRSGLLLHAFSILGYLYTGAGVVFYGIVQDSPALVAVHALAFVGVLANQVAFAASKRLRVAQNAFAAIGVLTIVPVFVTGGVGGAGVVWCFAYLIFAFSLTGARMGLVWGSALLLANGATLAVLRARGEPLPYAPAFLVDAAWAYLISGALLYLLNRAYEESQRRVEARLEQEREIDALRRMDAMRTTMLSTVSHELRTPLTPLKLQTQLLASEASGPLTERQRKAVTILRRNLDRLSALVEQTLDVSRIQGGHLQLDARPANVATLVREAASAFAEAAERQEVTLDATRAEDVTVALDEARVTQVVFNLVSNALKFTPPGGRVDVRVLREGDGARVEVQDSGAGIAVGAIPKLFQPFSRLEHAAEARTEGSGLGLFISKGIVEAHGGRIECRSDGAGKGATFAFTLPASPRSPGSDGSSR